MAIIPELGSCAIAHKGNAGTPATAKSIAAIQEKATRIQSPFVEPASFSAAHKKASLTGGPLPRINHPLRALHSTHVRGNKSLFAETAIPLDGILPTNETIIYFFLPGLCGAETGKPLFTAYLLDFIHQAV
jgi:hypothetical protein